jgi:plasmid replication initiation protein
MNYLDKSDNRIVVQDNRLIEACYSMTLIEKRVMYIGMSKINPRMLRGEKPQRAFDVTPEEYAKFFPDEVNAARALKKAALKLKSRFVTLHPREGRAKSINWFEYAEYDDAKNRNGTGMVELKFTPSVMPFLTPLLEQFTQVNLLSVSRLKSVHSIRLYELISQYKSTGYRVMTIEDFRIAMDVETKYKGTKLLVQKVLNPALEELNRVSDLKVNYKPLKVGKRIKQLYFGIENEDQLDLLND